MNRTVMVAVYGTLKRTHKNHELIAQAQFLGSAKLTQITLYDIGPYPGARLEPSSGIEVEVFAVCSSELAQLDILEEYDPRDPSGSLYTRELVETGFGLAWVYLYQGDVRDKPCLRAGAWHPLERQHDSQENEESA